ncbi:hypothetical protein [Tellurirhabdus rosea]|uniref:hypothetical protein n=1 Tax=Tellurirhabdus rosea TaxID=2674997 RepID=UPI0022564719|nr:hypothetical protein [Tellurirhabdus rosea]
MLCDGGRLPPLTALDLLELLLLQQACTPRIDQWGLDDGNLYPPEIRRLQQLVTLSNLFVPELAHLELPQKAEALLEGSFLLNRDPQHYSALLGQMQERIAGETALYKCSSSMELRYLQRTFTRLLRFKRLAGQLLSFNSGLLEANFYLYHSCLLTKAVGQAVDTAEIDEFLRAVIDPRRQAFTEAELVAKHGYPVADPTEDDLDFW